MSSTAKHLTFAQLVSRHEPRPIRSEKDLQKSHKEIERLMVRDDLSKDERDFLEVLSVLVETYEAREYPLRPASQADILEHYLEARSLTQAAVSRGTGISPATISSVLAGRRQFSKSDIRNLCRFLRVPAEVWLQV